MKKIFTFLIAIATVGFASAQDYRRQDHSFNEWNEKQHSSADRHDNRHDDNAYSKEYGPYNYNNGRYNDQYNERRRQEQIDCINREYDQRINTYRNNHRMSQRQRDRRIYQLNVERNQELKPFGTGAVVGAVAGFVLGTILSH